MAEDGLRKLVLLLATTVTLFVGAAARNSMLSGDMEIESLLRRLNKPGVKTIESEGGDTIDCVDINKQPAFDHPLLKNHTIQMRPSFFTEEDEKKTFSAEIPQLWRKNGSCPEGTIPIRRVLKSDLLRSQSLERFRTNAAANSNFVKAILESQPGKYYGAKATLNAWNGHVEPHEASSALLSVSSGSGGSISVGWTIDADLYGDQKTRSFFRWSADGTESTGCFNNRCPGFVHTNPQIALDGILSQVSTYNGEQHEITVFVYMDPPSKNWFVELNDVPVGYWPASIFKNMNTATTLSWGGEVRTAGAGGRTKTQMGSGHSPREDVGKAAYVGNILHLGDNGDYKQFFRPDKDVYKADDPQCYDMLSVGMDKLGGVGYMYLYGGPIC